MRIMPVLVMGLIAAQSPGWSQVLRSAVAPAPGQPIVTMEQPDAQRTREELSRLLERHPPTVRSVLQIDPALMVNQAYLAPYPALTAFLNAHPEIAHNPLFYVGEPPHDRRDPASQMVEMWRNALDGLGLFAAFGMAISVIVWLIRTLVDYRRWSLLAKVQTGVHTKLLDRFTANDDLLAYVQSPAGSKFLESSPIKLDAAPRAMGAPFGRILWSLQGGLVLMSGGIGLQIVSDRVGNEAAQPLNALGVLAVALGAGFVISAIISYGISQRLGLVEPVSPKPQADSPGA
jgi:hypothetical protein